MKNVSNIILFRSTMKRFISLLSVAICLVSCKRYYDPDLDNYSKLQIFGNSLGGNYELSDWGVNKTTGLYTFCSWPYEFAFGNYNGLYTSVLYRSTLYGKLSKDASKVEAYTFERYTERTKKISEQFEEYRRQLIEDKEEPVIKKATDEIAIGQFVSAYVRGLPTVKANGTLFGQEAWTELRDWFEFGDRNYLDITGPDYMFKGKTGTVGHGLDCNFYSAKEYFTDGKMFPLCLYCRTVKNPNEVVLDENEQPFEDPDVITVSFCIPVTFERYWKWCEALYSDPDAKEEFVDGAIYFKLRFKIKSPEQ